MTSTFIAPVALLSLFPHQEPRFIIPVLFPLVFLYAPELHQVSSLDIVRKPWYKTTGDSSPAKSQTYASKKLTVWYISNLVLVFFYAFMHQGGVLPLTSHIAEELAAKPYLTHVHLYTSYSYPVPTALLQLRNTRKIYRSGKRKYKLTQDFYLHEQGSKPLSQVFSILTKSMEDREEEFAVKNVPYRLYYALPASAINEFMRMQRNASRSLNVYIIKRFYPHVSLERLPSLQPLWKLQDLFDRQNDGIFSSFCEIVGDIHEYIGQFQLLLVRIEYLVPESKLDRSSK